MDASNMVTHELESYGMRTFSTKEMVFNILGLMYPLPLSTLQVGQFGQISLMVEWTVELQNKDI